LERIMHELSAVEAMVQAALAKADQVGSPRVAGMHFIINEGGHVSEDSVRLCFDISAQGTPAEGAQLHFQWNPPHYRCFECGHEFDGPHEADDLLPCPRCNETAVLIPPADEFYLDSIDVE
jgi:hydrogenase nickel incorporation protein HypA/HybF